MSELREPRIACRNVRCDETITLAERVEQAGLCPCCWAASKLGLATGARLGAIIGFGMAVLGWLASHG